MRLDRLLQSQGFGSRAACRALVCDGRVRVGEAVCTNPEAEVVPDSLTFSVDETSWRYRKCVYLLLNKPPQYECSHQPTHYPSVYSLLPQPLVTRGTQAVGRLDADTTGLLLLSDDGQFIHTFTSPKKSVEKCYVVGTRHPVSATQLEALLSGVTLRDDPQLVRATTFEIVNDRCVRMTVTEGRYHLVKRMIAAVGNRVETLARDSIGGLFLPPSLPLGQWQWLNEEDLATLGWTPAT